MGPRAQMWRLGPFSVHGRPARLLQHAGFAACPCIVESCSRERWHSGLWLLKGSCSAAAGGAPAGVGVAVENDALDLGHAAVVARRHRRRVHLQKAFTQSGRTRNTSADGRHCPQGSDSGCLSCGSDASRSDSPQEWASKQQPRVATVFRELKLSGLTCAMPIATASPFVVISTTCTTAAWQDLAF